MWKGNTNMDDGMKIGTKVFINENARVLLGLSEGIEYTIKDVLKEDVPCKIVLSAEELGKDWVQFFREDELIRIPKKYL